MKFAIIVFAATLSPSISGQQKQPAHSSNAEWKKLTCRGLVLRNLDLGRQRGIDQKIQFPMHIERRDNALSVSMGDTIDLLQITFDRNQAVAAQSGFDGYPTLTTLIVSADGASALYTQTTTVGGKAFPIGGIAMYFNCERQSS